MTPDKITITFEQLNLFVLCGKQYASSAEESILKIAVEELLPVALGKLKKYEQSLEKIRARYAKKTASKHIERDKYNNYQFTEKDLEDLTEAVNKTSLETTDLPYNIIDGEYPTDGLTWDMRMAFEGIVIPKIKRKFDDFRDMEEETPQADD